MSRPGRFTNTVPEMGSSLVFFTTLLLVAIVA
jgi:hypothetical protein